MTFPSTDIFTCIDTVLILPPFIDSHACCASLKHFRIWLCLSVTDYSGWDFLLFLLEGTRSRKMINTYWLLTEMHSQIRRKRQASVQGGTDSQTRWQSWLTRPLPLRKSGALPVSVTWNSITQSQLSLPDSCAELPGCRRSHQWKMKTLRDGYKKASSPLIWGVTESGPDHPQQGFWQWRCYRALQLQGGDSSCLHSPSK